MFVANNTLLAFDASLFAELLPVQELWENAIGSGWMGAFGVTIAVFAMGFWCVESYRELQKGTLIPVIKRSIYSLSLAVLLLNGVIGLMDATDVIDYFVNQTVCASSPHIDDLSCLNGAKISADSWVGAQNFGVGNYAESSANQDNLDLIASIVMGFKAGITYVANAMVPICLVLLGVSLFIKGDYKDKV